jgi:peptidoglycan/xylan/chitin deacetylase (PgdA/CDA1 family)
MPLIPNKREFLARRMRDAGLVALIERLARRPSLLVLTYHRIGDPSTQPYYAPVASASVEGLRDELRALARTHRVIGIDEVVALAKEGFRVKEPTALVTFDDGYRDNFDAALPVLRSLGVPATFFLPPGFLQEPRLPWWDHIAYVSNTTDRPTLRLDWPEPLEIDLNLKASRPAAIARFVRAYLDHHVSDERRFRALLEDRAGVIVDEDELGRALFMTWDQVRALVAAGMSVGSHSQTHRNLSRLSESDQRAELVESKRVLESVLGRAVETLAYPYGWPGTYDDLTARLAADAGYRVAFSSLEGVNHPGATDDFAVRRIGVGFADSPALHRARWALLEAFGRSFV